MTKQEFLKALEDLKQKAESSNVFDEPSVLWKPAEGETYYTIVSNGNVATQSYANEYSFHTKSYDCGNVFKTREQAEKYAKKRTTTYPQYYKIGAYK